MEISGAIQLGYSKLMPTVFSKPAMFSVHVEVSDRRLKQLKAAPDLAQQSLIVGAEYWHDGILPDHFVKGTQAKYGYAPRSRTYLKQNKGKPLLVHSESLREDVKSNYGYVTNGKAAVTVTMRAKVLNLAPAMPQNSGDLYVKHKNGRGYPNLKREIKVVTEDELEAITEVTQADLAERFDGTPKSAAADLVTA
jgi:hypothetical protein